MLRQRLLASTITSAAGCTPIATRPPRLVADGNLQLHQAALRCSSSTSSTPDFRLTSITDYISKLRSRSAPLDQIQEDESYLQQCAEIRRLAWIQPQHHLAEGTNGKARAGEAPDWAKRIFHPEADWRRVLESDWDDAWMFFRTRESQDPTYAEKETELRELIEDKVRRILSKEKTQVKPTDIMNRDSLWAEVERRLFAQDQRPADLTDEHWHAPSQ